LISSAPLAGRDAGFRLSLLYAAIFLTMGLQIPFLPVWLGARGLDDHQIAIILSTPQFLRVISSPLFAQWADRRGDFVGVLIAALVLMTGLGGMLSFLSGFVPILIATTLFACAQGVAMPLSDALTFAVIRARQELEYGRIRKWGSAAYIFGNLGAGLLLSLTSVSIIPLGMGVTALLSVGAAFHAAPLGALAQMPAPESSRAGGGRRLGILALVIAAATLVQCSHSLVNTFGSLHWAREGYSSVFVGAAWAIGVVCETTFFALAGRWVAGPRRAVALLGLGGLTALTRWLVMASNPGAGLLLLAQVGHGFSFAATHMGSMLLIFELAPYAMRARAQGWLTAAIAGASAIVVALCGPLYADLGEIAYLVMAGIAAAGVLLALFVGLRLRES
jgi:MFS transporter, PPP family, 3-phenylpropionic acid transporter